MVWHVEGQNTPITVCAGKRERKGFFESQCCGKGSVKNQNTKNHSFSLLTFLPKHQKPTALSTIPIQALMKVSKWIVFNNKHKTAVTPLFEMVLSVVSTLLSLKTQNTHTPWLSGA